MHKGPGNLVYLLKGLMQHNQDGAGLTQDRRLHNLTDFVQTVYQLYKLEELDQIRTTHVNYFVENLKARSINPHSMRVVMSDVRWLAQKIGKQNIVARENAHYNFPPDPRAQTKDRAWPDAKYLEVQAKVQELPRNERIAFAMRGAHELGFRLEEVSKVRPQDIDWQKNLLHLKRGTKGGRYRYVKLLTEGQRAWARDLPKYAKGFDQGIIPNQFTERSWKSHIDRTIRKAGGGAKAGFTFHGLRHTFAQNLYRTLTKTEPPIAGGKPDRDAHVRACTTISKVLGHNRWRITETYVGKL